MKTSKLLALSIMFIAINGMATVNVFCQSAPTPEWTDKIKRLAPQKATVQTNKSHRVLLFSLYTGYKHDVIPYVKEVFFILSDKSKAFELEMSDDIESLALAKLEQFDALILNNNCSVGPGRNIFLDALTNGAQQKDSPYAHYSDEMQQQKASELEAGLIEYVANGAGLMAVHGAIVMQNSSKAFNDMLGGSFDFHPKNQQVYLRPVDPGHALLRAFEGQPFEHKDEPYIFSSSYQKKNFRPLLKMDTKKLDLGEHRKRVLSDIRYVSWIKKHGAGRVFYVSPSHNASSYENKKLLQFYLDGLQYVLGDLKCDDSPLMQN